jgi:hypothetical protein
VIQYHTGVSPLKFSNALAIFPSSLSRLRRPACPTGRLASARLFWSKLPSCTRRLYSSCFAPTDESDPVPHRGVSLEVFERTRDFSFVVVQAEKPENSAFHPSTSHQLVPPGGSPLQGCSGQNCQVVPAGSIHESDPVPHRGVSLEVFERTRDLSFVVVQAEKPENLSHREARLCKAVLVKIAKLYPQALFFLLRTNRDNLAILTRTALQRRASRWDKLVRS